MSFYTKVAEPTDKCHECGESAVVVIINEIPNPDDAADELALCDKHFKETLNRDLDSY